MRSRLLIAVLMIAALATAGTAQAQTSANLFTGKIAPGITKKFSFTSTESIIIGVKFTAFAKTDVDIVVVDVTNDGDAEDDDRVIGDFSSGVLRMEEGVISVGGGRTIDVCVTSASGPNSRYTLVFYTLAATDIVKGPSSVQVREAGEFSVAQPSSDADTARLQEIVSESLRVKR